MLVDNALESQ